MVLSFDEAGELLDAMAESFPPAFFSDLNGGILLLPEAHPDPDFPPGEMSVSYTHLTLPTICSV